jgi:hypothetical protein
MITDEGKYLDDVEVALHNIHIVDHVTAIDMHASSILTASVRQTQQENGAIVRPFCHCSCHDEEVSIFSSKVVYLYLMVQVEIQLTPTCITIMYAIGQLQHKMPYGALLSEVQS